jgi:hypothetical protein
MIGFIGTSLHLQSIMTAHTLNSFWTKSVWQNSGWTECQSRSQSYVTTDDQSASLSWNKAPIWGLRPELYYCQTVAGLLIPELESELLYNWRFTAYQFVLEPSPLRLTAKIYFLNWAPAFIVLMQHPVSREDGSVLYNWCWSSPAHSFSRPSPARLETLFYCL